MKLFKDIDKLLSQKGKIQNISKTQLRCSFQIFGYEMNNQQTYDIHIDVYKEKSFQLLNDDSCTEEIDCVFVYVKIQHNRTLAIVQIAKDVFYSIEDFKSFMKNNFNIEFAEK